MPMTAKKQPQTKGANNHSGQANISGLPLWKLSGVSDHNKETITTTDHWIHYTKEGDNGWGLVATNEQIEQLRPTLKKSKITIQAWDKEPFNKTLYKAMLLACLFGPIMLQMAIASTLSHYHFDTFIILYNYLITIPCAIIIIHQLRASVKYAPALSKEFAKRNHIENHEDPDRHYSVLSATTINQFARKDYSN